MSYFFNFEKIAYIRGERPKGCILCQIRDGSEAVEDLTVFKNRLFTVSVNLYPYNPGHLLIFPHRHIEDVRELTRDEAVVHHEVVRFLLDILDVTHSPSGYNFGWNMGLDAGASILHLHSHVVPRYPRELGFADLIVGKRVLVEDPRETADRISDQIASSLSRQTRSSLTT